MRDIERYLNIRSAYGATFSPDGTLAFLTDTTGVPQVWTLEAAREWPEQRTFYDERVTFASWSPERPELVFGMDEGGNERTQFYRLDPDGSVTDLTRHPDAKHRWGGWSHDGERFAFASNRRDEAVFDVYAQARNATGEDARLIHETDGWFSVGSWGPDDERLVLVESHSNFDQDVYVLDVESGDRHHLTAHDGETGVRFRSLSWGPEGNALYCATDRGADTLYLARLAIDGSGDLDDDIRVVEEGGDWNVDGVVLDDETGRLVYSRNADGYTDLTVGELAGGTEITEYPRPDIPAGVAGGVDFDDDATRFAVTVTADTRNPNVYVVDVETGESQRWTRAATAGIPRESFRTSDLVRYETFDGRSIPALFALPSESVGGRDGGHDGGHDGGRDGENDGGRDGGRDGGGGTPVIVDIHGGPESQRRPSFGRLKQYFLANGYAVFEPNVRGSTGYGREYTHLDDGHRRMDAVHDVERGVAWLRKQDAVDGDRIVALGGSYGGFVVLAAMTEYPALWAAGVDVVGIANFVTFLENTGAWRRELREAEYGSLAEDREFLEAISPVNRIEQIRAPLFVLHGANDPRVPVEEAERIAEEAQNHVPVEKLIFEDEGHGISKLENRIEAYSRVVSFLDEHV